MAVRNMLISEARANNPDRRNQNPIRKWGQAENLGRINKGYILVGV